MEMTGVLLGRVLASEFETGQENAGFVPQREETAVENDAGPGHSLEQVRLQFLAGLQTGGCKDGT
ncbi:MAG: hypothetical protein JXO49_12605 [Deltaproteobacteria bacterium]|nr:hypothetical protein [Candidatus Anaeroferrophillus wilburensis]MBN2890169.1 hypothetical protein [Deltaproteobacteria bacterium]